MNDEEKPKLIETCSGCYSTFWDSDPNCMGCHPELRPEPEFTRDDFIGRDIE